MAPDDLQSDWLAAALGEPVIDVARAQVGTGQVGTSVRCHLTYGPGASPSAPATVVVKMPSIDETSRLTGVALRNYEREVNFYRELRATVDIRTPRCHHLDWEPSTGDFALVLEDLAPAVQGDQIAGCSVAEAGIAMHELAALHAPRWDDDALHAIEWLSRRGPDDAERVQGLYQMFWPGFIEHYERWLTAEQIALGEWLGSAIVAWLDARMGPFTVTHGDYRLDNMMFGTSAGGYPLAVVDWQTPGHGPGTADLAYFIGAGLSVEARRANEHDLVHAYHDELTRRGVRGWSFDDCWTGYRLHAFSGVAMAVIASAIVGRTDRGDEMFVAMGTRHLQHALDVESRRLVV